MEHIKLNLMQLRVIYKLSCPLYDRLHYIWQVYLKVLIEKENQQCSPEFMKNLWKKFMLKTVSMIKENVSFLFWNLVIWKQPSSKLEKNPVSNQNRIFAISKLKKTYITISKKGYSGFISTAWLSGWNYAGFFVYLISFVQY